MDLCCLVLAVNIFCRIYRIFCPCINGIFIDKTQVPCLSCHAGKDFAIFADSDLSFLLLVSNRYGRCFSRNQRHIERRGIQFITLRHRNFFQIYRILCFHKFYFGRTICISCRHLSNQVRTRFIGINTKNGSRKVYLRSIVFFNDLHFGFIQFQGYACFTVFRSICCLLFQECDILCIRNQGFIHINKRPCKFSCSLYLECNLFFSDTMCLFYRNTDIEAAFQVGRIFIYNLRPIRRTFQINGFRTQFSLHLYFIPSGLVIFAIAA